MPVKTDGIEDIYGLSPMQAGMLFHGLYTEGGTYLHQMLFRVDGRLDLSAFEKAWRGVTDRHPILRTSFHWEDLEEPLQVVQEKVDIPLTVLDWASLPESEQDSRLQQLFEQDRTKGFPLDEAPLMRITLVKQSENCWSFLWTSHHILLDRWSNSVVIRELQSLYDAFCRGDKLRLPAVRPFGDYVEWLNEQDQEQAEIHWREKLAGFSSPTVLPFDSAPGSAHSADEDLLQTGIELDERLTEEIQDFLRRSHLTLATLIQGAWAILLNRYSREEDVLFGVTVSGRPPEIPNVDSIVGLFINTLPLRVKVDSSERVIPWLQSLQAQAAEMRRYEYSPLVKVQAHADLPRGIPLFETLVVVQNTPPPAGNAESDVVEFKLAKTFGTHNLPVALTAVPGARLRLVCHHNTARFDRDAVERVLGHLKTLLQAAMASTDCEIAALPILTDAERTTILGEWSRTEAEYRRDICFHQLFEERVNENPGAGAILFADESGEQTTLTYTELNARANRLAHYLREQGVVPETLVGLCLERSPEMIVGLLAILKAGGAYLPLDPSYPRPRLAHMIEDSSPAVILTDSSVETVLPSTGVPLIRFDLDSATIYAQTDSNPPASATPDSLAYIIYTSGSTGKPKGVMLEHRGLLNVIAAQQHHLGIGQGMRILQFASLSFDASIFEIAMALGTCSTLCMGSRNAVMPGAPLAKYLRDNRINVVVLPPSALSAVPAGDYPDLRIITVAGEACPGTLVSQWEPGRRFYNLYGPTEATIWSSYAECTDGSTKPTIGRPVQNTSLYVLDPNGQPVPAGVPGELHIGGHGGARGYLNRPDLTAERFVDYPTSRLDSRLRGNDEADNSPTTQPPNDPTTRLYKTGDLVRWLPDGNLDFLGRIDHQVKLRGFRIELGEIEEALTQHDGIRDAAVIVREDTPGQQKLAAYVVQSGSDTPSNEELRAHLKDRLPAHMIPNALVWMESLPISPNGKVDRKALPAPDAIAAEGARLYAEPETVTEIRLAQIWKDILHVEKVGRNDDFFELGAHSLLAVRLVTEIEQVWGRRIPLTLLFDGSSLEFLAATIDDNTDLTEQRTLIPVQPRGSRVPLYCVSRPNVNALGYLFLARNMDPDQPVYGLQSAFRGENESPWSEEEFKLLAREYIAEIKKVQPRGPYQLAGYCEGAHIAFHMARILKEQGDEVGLLAILDTWPIEHTRRRFLTFVYAWDKRVQRTLRRLKRRLIPENQPQSDLFKATGALAPEPADQQGQSEVRNAFAQRYWPAAPWKPPIYDGKITVFRAGTGHPYYRVQDPEMCWGVRTSVGVELHLLESGHSSLMREPWVQELARKLQDCLDRAQADTPAVLSYGHAAP